MANLVFLTQRLQLGEACTIDDANPRTGARRTGCPAQSTGQVWLGRSLSLMHCKSGAVGWQSRTEGSLAALPRRLELSREESLLCEKERFFLTTLFQPHVELHFVEPNFSLPDFSLPHFRLPNFRRANSWKKLHCTQG